MHVFLYALKTYLHIVAWFLSLMRILGFIRIGFQLFNWFIDLGLLKNCIMLGLDLELGFELDLFCAFHLA